jgi:Tfp pilus assembly protein PilF
LDINLGWLWLPRVGQLMSANKPKEARDAAAKIVQYMPSANAQVTLGVADYNLGDKSAALADFRKALEMDANVKRQFDPTAAPQIGRGQRLRAILEDKEFIKQLFPE